LNNEKNEAVKKINGENFNIFSILKLETDEVKTHSYMAKDIIDIIRTPADMEAMHTIYTEYVKVLILDIIVIVEWLMKEKRKILFLDYH